MVDLADHARTFPANSCGQERRTGLVHERPSDGPKFDFLRLGTRFSPDLTDSRRQHMFRIKGNEHEVLANLEAAGTN